MTRSVTVLLAATLATGCYGAAPPHPATIPLPPLADAPDAEIVVHTASKTTIENVAKQSSTCPAGKGEGDPSCVITRYEVAEPVTRTISTATLDGTPISYAQLRVISDPDRGHKLSTLDHLSHVCTRANVPRYVGLGLVIGGLIVAGIGANHKSSAIAWTGYGAVGGGLGSYALGYFNFGGRQCNEATRLYTQLDVSGQTEWTEVAGEDYAVEMQAMAATFNASRGGPRSAMRMRR